MTINDFLALSIQICFILLGLITAVDYLLHRNKTRRDIALMFGSFALLYMIPVLSRILNGTASKEAGVLAGIALVPQPFLMLRLLQYFRRVPAWMIPAATISMIFLAFAVAATSSLPPVLLLIAQVVLVAYFAVFDGYAMVAFVKGALNASGVVRNRLRFAAAGSGFLASFFPIAALILVFPPLREFLTSIASVAAIASVLSFYVGFATPRWLRRTWQLSELRTFLLQMSHKPLGERLNTGESLDELCRSAALAVGAMVAAVAQEDAAQKQWTLGHVSNQSPMGDIDHDGDGIIKRAWHDRAPMFIHTSDSLTKSDRRLLQTVGADTLLVAPIATAPPALGLLLVFLKYSPLFPEDDLELITLLAQQSAIFLENAALIEELHRHSEQLEKSVEERTAELQQSQKQYRRIVETSQEGIWLSDTENKVLFVNARMADMLGYSVEEMIGESGYKFLDPDNAALSRAKRVERNQGVKEQYELKFRRKDNTELITLVSATPLSDEDGQVLGSLAMLADITERKRAEDEILKLNAELEQRVVERTAQLSAVNRELESFSYSVSHDLRAPLRAMDGFSQALLEDYSDVLDDEGKGSLQRIRAASQRMGHLIDALLELARVSRAELNFEQVNLSELAHALEADLREEYPGRQVEFIIADGLVVRGDERLLRAALSNLLRNAWKFTSKQPHPRVEFGVQDKDRHAYYIRDNGVGFDMTYANKLFGAFQRLHHTSEFEGTGIGLATVERIIHRHDGTIWAEAAVDQGATFYFSLSGGSTAP